MTPNQKTGNRKCWHVRNRETNEILVRGPLTRDAALRMAGRYMDAKPGVVAALCLDGYHFEPATDTNKDPALWGVVMVEDE